MTQHDIQRQLNSIPFHQASIFMKIQTARHNRQKSELKNMQLNEIKTRQWKATKSINTIC